MIDAENHEITRLSTRTPDPVHAPMPGFAEVTVNVKGAPAHVHSTHLDHRADPSVREAQVADMLDVLAADRGPKILVGDFNAEATAAERRPGRRWDLSGGRPGQARRLGGRLCGHHRGRCRSGGEAVATEASDHRPVVTDLKVRRRGR
ncbi:endonuclease/exonuclease/phosphatase family protein [Streptomyces incanus]|uniref:Endonuclease/exonuclease/phosphatase family protein n=1 Tax=Streptomyces incanus TaxID=887453 RepID=A0ABW0XSE3_9ACTN